MKTHSSRCGRSSSGPCAFLGMALLSLHIASPTVGQTPQAHKINTAAVRLVDVTGQEIREGDFFGRSVAAIGDLNKDGVPDLAVGAPVAYGAKGAVWILFMRANGSVGSARVITQDRAGFDGMLRAFDAFGASVASLGDLDGDGTLEVAVGAEGDDTQAQDGGTVWILSLTRDATVNSARKLLGLAAATPGAKSGRRLTAVGDLDGNGTTDLAVNGECESAGVTASCAAWMWLLNQQGRILHESPISLPYTGEQLSMAAAGDIDQDGVADLLIGVSRRDRSSALGGPKIDLVLLKADGSTKSVIRLKSEHPSYSPPDDQTGPANDPPPIKSDSAYVPTGLAVLNDLNADGWPEIAVGSYEGGGTVFHDPGPEPIPGTLTILFPDFRDLRATEIGVEHRTAGQLRHGVGALLHDHDQRDRFGVSVTNLGDLDGDGQEDLAIGADRDNEIATDQGAVWIVMNPPAPSPNFSSTVTASGGRPTVGRPVRVSALVLDSPSEPSGGNVLFRRSGDGSFFSLDMEDGAADDHCRSGAATPTLTKQWGTLHDTAVGRGANNIEKSCWTAEIPEFAVSDRGIDYYVTISVDEGPRGRDPDSGFHSLQVHVPSGLTTRTFGGTATDGYRLVAFPLDLDANNALDVLEDDLGPFDRRRWRFFQHSSADLSNDGRGSLAEVDERPIEIRPGVAYWLLVKDDGRLINTGPGWSPRTDSPFEVTLGYGWNLVSNPYNFDVSISQVTTSAGIPIQSLTVDGRVDILHYEGDWIESGDSLQSGTGYALFVQDCLDEEICNLGISGKLLFHSDKSTVPANGTKWPQALPHSWAINVQARQGRARDLNNHAGAAPDSESGWDRRDRPEPPQVGDFVSVAFADHRYGSAGLLRHDYRPEPVEGETWNLLVRSRTTRRVQLDFKGTESVPDELSVWLIDDAAGLWQDLRANSKYALAGPGEGKVRRFRLVVGTGAFFAHDMNEIRPIPSRFGLAKAYPNPFSDATTIRFGLTEQSTINLEVYDILGRRVRTLLDGEKKDVGYHIAVWDSRDNSATSVASGVYLVRLQTGSRVDTGSISLVR